MAVNLVGTFETNAAKQAAGYETLRAQGIVLDDNRWKATTGTDMESEYNAGGMGADDTPPDGQITQNRMNNYIRAVGYINKFLSGTFVQADLDWIVTNNLNIPAAIAGVAQYDLGAQDNS